MGAAAPAASASASDGAFAALAALHAAGVTHGDARLANLLDVDGELRWIDLVGGVAAAPASPAFAALARADAETLTRSLLRAAAPAALPEGVAAALGAYACGGAGGRVGPRPRCLDGGRRQRHEPSSHLNAGTTCGGGGTDVRFFAANNERAA